MPRVSAEHKAEVRRRLLDAARRVVLRDGAAQVTTRAIVDEADLSAGALYTYFASKEELLRELAAETFEANVLPREPGETPGEHVARLIVAALSEPHPDPVVALLRSRSTPDRAVQDAMAELNAWIVERFAPLVEAAQQEGTLAPGHDPEAMVELIDLIFDGMNLRAANGTIATSFGRVAEVALAVVGARVAERVHR